MIWPNRYVVDWDCLQCSLRKTVVIEKHDLIVKGTTPFSIFSTQMHILSAFLFLSLCLPLSISLRHITSVSLSLMLSLSPICTHCKTFSDCRSYNNFLAQSLKIKHTHKSSFPLSLFLSHSISLYQMHFYLIPFCPLYIVGIVGTMREN